VSGEVVFSKNSVKGFKKCGVKHPKVKQGKSIRRSRKREKK
jgi:hypothetical protein